ncbi:GRB2-associated-binding protein 3 isoform X2 [Esox lucius]|nr:GRB2-associated-binding protein 3 isoform X2 [Esox lucius]
MSGNPDVLEYYRNKTSKKPIRIIDLKECEVHMQMEQRLVKREFENQPLFIIKTLSRIFYLVAKTEEEMNSWVSQIREICHFGPLDDGTESEEGFSQTPTSQQPSPALSQNMSFISNHDFVAIANSRVEISSQIESHRPLDYLFLSQCETGRFSISRCDSFSNSERSLEQTSSDATTEDVFSSPLGTDPSLSPFPDIGLSPCPFPHIRTLDPPFSAPCAPASSSSPPRTLHHTPNVFQFDKPYSSTVLEATSDGITPPPLPPKPTHLSEYLSNEGFHGPLGVGKWITGQPSLIPRRISLSGLPDQSRKGDIEGSALRSRNKRLSLNLPYFIATPNYQEDSYVPMASPTVCADEDLSDGYIPMSPTPISFLKANGITDAPLAPSLLTTAGLHGDLEPPPVDRNLKPRRRARPPPLDLRDLSTIRECPTLIRTMTDPGNVLVLERRQRSLGIKEEQEANIIPAESRHLLFAANDVANQPWLRRSNLDYLSLDFNSASPSPVQKKPFLADEHRVDYVQVDEKKTQALQNTKMEWKDVRQSKV